MRAGAGAAAGSAALGTLTGDDAEQENPLLDYARYGAVAAGTNAATSVGSRAAGAIRRRTSGYQTDNSGTGRGSRVGRVAGKLGRFGRFGALAGGAAGLLGGVFQAVQARREERSTGQVVGSGVGGTAGGIGAGAVAGAALGSIIPVIGTTIGGIIGGLLGSEFGSEIGQKIASEFAEGNTGKQAQKIADNINKDDAFNAFEAAARQSVIDGGWLGNDEINDWNTIRRLNPRQITNIIRQGDWDKPTLKRLRAIRDNQSFGDTIPVDLSGEDIANKLTERSVIDRDMIGKAEINDWDAIRQLKVGQLQRVLEAEQFVPEDAQQIRQIIQSKGESLPSIAQQLSGRGSEQAQQLEQQGVIDRGWFTTSVEDEDAIKKMKIGQIKQLLKAEKFDDQSHQLIYRILGNKLKKSGRSIGGDSSVLQSL